MQKRLLQGVSKILTKKESNPGSRSYSHGSYGLRILESKIVDEDPWSADPSLRSFKIVRNWIKNKSRFENVWNRVQNQVRVFSVYKPPVSLWFHIFFYLFHVGRGRVSWCSGSTKRICVFFESLTSRIRILSLWILRITNPGNLQRIQITDPFIGLKRILILFMWNVIKIAPKYTGTRSENWAVTMKWINFPFVFQLLGCVSPLYPIICQSFHF